MAKKGKSMKIPLHLSVEARKHWNRITKDFELTPDTAMILETGLANWDMAQKAREIFRSEGLVLNGRRHPAIEIQKHGDLIFLRSMRELGLNISDPGDVGRPPDALGAGKDRRGPSTEPGALLF